MTYKKEASIGPLSPCKLESLGAHVPTRMATTPKPQPTRSQAGPAYKRRRQRHLQRSLTSESPVQPHRVQKAAAATVCPCKIRTHRNPLTGRQNRATSSGERCKQGSYGGDPPVFRQKTENRQKRPPEPVIAPLCGRPKRAS